LRKFIGVFSKAAAAVGLLFQKGTVHLRTPTQLTKSAWHGLWGIASVPANASTTVAASAPGAFKNAGALGFLLCQARRRDS
jgi:hypothetical protein